MGITKIHRKYPSTKWEFRALSKRVDGKDIIYGEGKDRGKSFKGVEVYSGKNYIVGSSAPSYSRRYSVSKVPKIYRKEVAELKRKHNKTKWSKKKRVDSN